MTFFWVKSPCELVGRNQRFGEECCSHLQGWRWRQHASPKRWFLPTSSEGYLTQKNIIKTERCLLIYWTIFSLLNEKCVNNFGRKAWKEEIVCKNGS
jgi:hypothetical protein